MKFAFVKLNDSHLSLMHNWLNQPHVADYWDGRVELEEVRKDYFSSDVATVDGDDRWMVSMDGRPVAYVQRYWTLQSEPGWWEGERDSGTCGIDFFIGESTLLNLGVGSAMLSQLVQMLFIDTPLHKIIADPSPQNLRSIRCLEKVGFKRVGEILTPDGPAILMEMRRSQL